ncbi:hypothetical protein [Streptomyces sp. NPDC001678]|uniref:hypothetical protein n=1 Tax=Streptomyces sp. NPDC001678 TaxID=3364599 RepID=UPI0036A9A521
MPHTPEQVSEAHTRKRCEECQRIKGEYYAACHTGDRERAAYWATTMGRHQRQAHA